MNRRMYLLWAVVVIAALAFGTPGVAQNRPGQSPQMAPAPNVIKVAHEPLPVGAEIHSRINFSFQREVDEISAATMQRWQGNGDEQAEAEEPESPTITRRLTGSANAELVTRVVALRDNNSKLGKVEIEFKRSEFNLDDSQTIMSNTPVYSVDLSGNQPRVTQKAGQQGVDDQIVARIESLLYCPMFLRTVADWIPGGEVQLGATFEVNGADFLDSMRSRVDLQNHNRPSDLYGWHTRLVATPVSRMQCEGTHAVVFQTKLIITGMQGTTMYHGEITGNALVCATTSLLLQYSLNGQVHAKRAHTSIDRPWYSQVSGGMQGMQNQQGMRPGMQGPRNQEAPMQRMQMQDANWSKMSINLAMNGENRVAMR